MDYRSKKMALSKETENMIEILSLPRRPTINAMQMQNPDYKPGLPINSLPGWESIPLNSKLPMLKCPGNQVVFSKNKIGQRFKNPKQEFDPCGRDRYPEYNPLHDSNLRYFYSNERNLKRLRQNGEITANNDVICTLKDFNEYRTQLHKSYLYYVLQELNKGEVYQHDNLMMGNADHVTFRDHRNIHRRLHTYPEILARKKQFDEQRASRFRYMLLSTEQKFQRIASLAQMRHVLIEHRKVLNNLKMQQHWDVRNDLLRKHLITQKKRSQFKTDRLERNLAATKELRLKEATEKQIRSWESRLNERITNQHKVRDLLDHVNARRKMFIENHRAKYALKWERIQEEIQKRAVENQTRGKRKRKVRRVKKPAKPKEEKTSFCDVHQDGFERLMDAELCEALNAAIDIEGNINLPFSNDDPIYKAAEFIMQHILKNFDKDLSNDKRTYTVISERIGRYFEEAKKFVLFRATQIIAAARENQNAIKEKIRSTVLPTRRPTLPRYVSFNKIQDTIGTSSYEIHPLMDVKNVTDRAPTPAGSLASLVVHSKEDMLKGDGGYILSHLCRNELVYLEYFVIKFKRELIVGMGKRVFAAIDLHFEDKIMDVRKELRELDRNYLVDQMTKAILGHAVNPLNYESCIKLCISALSSDIVWSLQKHLLKPNRDPRGIVCARQGCACETDCTKLCLYCFHNCN